MSGFTLRYTTGSATSAPSDRRASGSESPARSPQGSSIFLPRREFAEIPDSWKASAIESALNFFGTKPTLSPNASMDFLVAGPTAQMDAPSISRMEREENPVVAIEIGQLQRFFWRPDLDGGEFDDLRALGLKVFGQFAGLRTGARYDYFLPRQRLRIGGACRHLALIYLR